ncbi:MAG: 50S ribosomal protein L9 [Candidatus Omnitrophica bacterium]|nr:50S ribosomal protein L9 [Candidatus Omnitrophota bacterium]
MKVILLQTIDKLGKAGDVVTVKEGYARNFLIPKNAAKEATAGNTKILESLKKKQAEEDAKRLAEAKVVAEKISALSLTIPAQAGEEDKLFGSVSGEDIAKALLAEGVKAEKRDITLSEPIKKLGEYQAVVKLHPEVKVSVKVSIVKK